MSLQKLSCILQRNLSNEPAALGDGCEWRTLPPNLQLLCCEPEEPPDANLMRKTNSVNVARKPTHSASALRRRSHRSYGPVRNAVHQRHYFKTSDQQPFPPESVDAAS
jgi:hypothetical protein